MLSLKIIESTVPLNGSVITLRYLGKMTFQIRTRINRIMKNKLPYCNLRFVFQTERSSRPEMFCKKGVLRNFTKSTGKHLCQSLFFNKVAN